MINVTTTVQVPEQRMLDMVISALDSASIRYWLRRYGDDKDEDAEEEENDGCHYVTKLPDGFDPNALGWLDEKWSPDVRRDYFAPLVEGGTMTLFVEDDRDDGKDAIVLDLAAMLRGIEAMAKHEPKHFHDLVCENDDATTADVFMQCCAFGKVVY